MMSEAQIRGLLLEEAVLHLLRRAGYDPISEAGTDPTLEQDGQVVFVRGRGERHQIDAIADYLVRPPFSNPLRLLVEAKFYDDRQVGLTVIRNALGVMSDVCQHFVAPARNEAAKKVRYHYQYAVVSATKFSSGSQRYAYAHDIFLIPLGESKHFFDVLQVIREAAAVFVTHPQNRNREQFAVKLRIRVRQVLWHIDTVAENIDARRDDDQALVRFTGQCEIVGFVLVAVTESGFPIFLVPQRGVQPTEIPSEQNVRIYMSEEGWLLTDQSSRPLFSFDLPEELVRLYSSSRELSPRRAIDLKGDEFRVLRATVVTGQAVRSILFRLDEDWYQSLRR